MFKIAIESPINLMEEVENHTHYSYVLFHLLKSYPKYFSFYKKLSNEGREIILDNSAYEFYVKGENLNIEEYVEYIQELKPTYYIIPDKLNDSNYTLENFFLWLNKYSDLPGKKIGVIQGNSFLDWLYCFRELDGMCDKLAVSFGYSFLSNLTFKFNIPDNLSSCKEYLFALGRKYLLEYLKNNNLIKNNKIHLLGSYLAAEFLWYKDFDFIDSIDTSIPIKKGFLNEPVLFSLTETKPHILIDDLMNIEFDEKTSKLMLNNVDVFMKKLNS